MLEFSHNFCNQKAIVQGLDITVTMETIADVSGLPLEGEQYFPKTYKQSTKLQPTQNKFLQRGKSMEMVVGQGTKLQSLPGHWREVVRYIIHYITCEGRFQYVFAQHFKLMLHL